MRHLFLFLVIVLLASCGEETQGLTPEEYVTQNNLDAVELEYGVYIVVHEEGSDVQANLDDVVHVSYTGRLTNEEVFDDSDDYKNLLGNLIPGWAVGLNEIGVGGSCTMIIPHEMAYGNTQNGPIPPRSTLIFEVELLDVFSTRTVNQYIEDNDMNTVLLEKGVHIEVHEEGNGVKPTIDSDVTVSYTGKLTNELVFDQGKNVKFKLSNLIEGWQIGLLELDEGGSCTMVIPSNVAYGSNGAGSIPPDAPLVFEIELIKVD